MIPPSLDLPPPDQADASARNPAWPREQTRKKTRRAGEAADLRARPKTRARVRACRPTKCAAAPIRTRQRVTDPSKSGSQEETDIGRPLRPNELGSSSIFNWRALTGNYANETAKFTGEPRAAS